MGRLVRVAWLVVLALLPAFGCGASKRPYAHDPLIRDHGAVWGDHGRASGRTFDARAEPVPPRAPNPVNLPTREWEATDAD